MRADSLYFHTNSSASYLSISTNIWYYFTESNTSILCSYNFEDSILHESTPRNRTFLKTRPYFIFFLKNSAYIFCRIQKMHYICIRNQATRALSSVGSEHLVYTQRVGGSNPSAPTEQTPKGDKKMPKSCKSSGLQDFFLLSPPIFDWIMPICT